MTPLQDKRMARVLLAAGSLLALAILGLRRAPGRISTDIMDLVPQAESAGPELALIRGLAGERGSRVVLIALDRPRGSPPGSRAGAGPADELDGVRQACMAELRASRAFEEVEPMDGGLDRDATGRLVFDRRFDLMGPTWLAEAWREHQREAPRAPWSPWLAERTAARLEAFLDKPEALGFQGLIQQDPLLLVPSLVDRLQLTGPPGGRGDGSGGPAALIWALSRGSPLDVRGQAEVSAALGRAEGRLAAAAPGVRLRWTGVTRLAAASREHIQGEVSRLNLLSLAGVLVVALLCVRRPGRALHLAPVVLLSMLGAWTVVMLAFDRVHVLVFIVGSLLCGVAIDYGFYIFLQPPARPEEPYRGKVGRLLRPLLASSLTVVLGFSLLLASDLPLIRQVGVFVSAGLLTALGAAILWFAQVDDPFLETRPIARIRLEPGSRWGRLVARSAFAGAGLVALIGPWRLTWRDDIRDLQIPAPILESNDRDLRALFGDSPERTIYITRGRTAQEARVRLDRFMAWHAGAFPGAGLVSIGSLLPEPGDWGAVGGRVEGLGSFEADLRAALERHGFYPDAFKPFFGAWSDWRGAQPSAGSYGALASGLEGALRGPVSLTMACRADACWLMSVAEHRPGAEPPASTGTVSTHQLESLNRLFGRYRLSALRLSALGLGLVGLSVFAIYGLRQGPRIFAVPAGSCLFAFGLLGLLGHPLNLFHLLGAFLGVCLAHNYAIFSWENAARRETAPPSIRLSALCTATSFGVLAMSGIPVVATLGSTVAVIVLAALAAVELAPCCGRRPGLAGDRVIR